MKKRQAMEHATTSRHVCLDSRPHLPIEVGSCTATCWSVLDLASLLRRAPTLPCIPWLWTPPPCKGGLRRYYVPYASGPRLPTGEVSGATTCLAVLHGPPDIGMKKGTPACFRGTLSCFKGAHACFHGMHTRAVQACKACG
jgi:hypothetical protein